VLINSIELKNITTHVSTRIDFEEGENVLMGGNGTGKTTVLTMIGYVLFDHLPGKKKNYVRNGHDNHKKKIKYGTITLWITSSQGDNYTIKRTLGKQSEIIKVIHTDLDDELTEISNNNRLNEWLRNLISLNDNFSLSTIFENAIGVKQGTFTAPFLMSTSNRSKIFAPLLNVHIYKKIWENYLQISHGFSDRIQSIENRKENIQGQLKQKNEDIKEQKEIQKNLNLDEKSFEKSELEFKKLHKQFEDLKSKKKDLDNIHQSIDKLQISKNKRFCSSCKNM